MPRNVALFVTCLTDQFYPNVGIAITKILEHFGCTVHFPSAQTCCGQPLYNNGFHDQARQLATRMIEIFEPFEHIVTPSASCCAMVRQHFPRLLAGDHAWESGLHRLTSRTFEFIEFLDKILHVDFSALKLPKPQTVTYHYNCHLRSLGITDRPLTLLREIRNLEFRPMQKADQCCGFGGTFSLHYPHISGAISQDKTDCIAATDAQTVISNDAGCSLNISGHLHRQNIPTQTRHLAELIAEALALDLTQW